MIMSKDEDRRCGQVAELFRPFLEEAGDWCVVRSEQFGYIVLCYYVDGRFEDIKRQKEEIQNFSLEETERIAKGK